MGRDFIAAKVMAVIPAVAAQVSQWEKECGISEASIKNIWNVRSLRVGRHFKRTTGKLDDHLDGCLECRRAFNELRVSREHKAWRPLSPVLTRESIAGDIKAGDGTTARRLRCAD